MSKIPKRATGFLLPFIILLGAIVRMYEIGRESLWYDELFPLWASRLPLGGLFQEVPASGHPPLYYLIGHVWFAISTNDTWVRLISWTAGVFTIWLMYLVGRELFSRRTGLWAAALAAGSPFLYWYSREASDYSLLIAFSAASLYFLARSANRGGWANWTAYVLTTTAALFTHYYGAFVLLAEVVFFLIIRDRRVQKLRPWLISEAALAGAVVLWMFINRSASGWVVLNMPGPGMFLEALFRRGPVALLWGIMPLNHAEVAVPYWVARSGTQLLIALMLLGSLALSAQFRKAIWQKRVLALIILNLMFLAGPVLGQELRDTFVSIRFFAIAIVPFLLLLAVFITALPRRIGAAAGGVALIVFLSVTGWTLSHYYYDNWRGAMTTVSSEQQAGDRMLCFPISECTMAAHHYLNDTMSVSGGFISPGRADSPSFYPLGAEWQGYRMQQIYGQAAPLSGSELESRLQQELQGTDRVWILAGDGSADDILRAEAIYGDLDKSWKQAGEWQYLPLILRLYVRAGDRGSS